MKIIFTIILFISFLNITNASNIEEVASYKNSNLYDFNVNNNWTLTYKVENNSTREETLVINGKKYNSESFPFISDMTFSNNWENYFYYSWYNSYTWLSNVLEYTWFKYNWKSINNVWNPLFSDIWDSFSYIKLDWTNSLIKDWKNIQKWVIWFTYSKWTNNLIYSYIDNKKLVVKSEKNWELYWFYLWDNYSAEALFFKWNYAVKINRIFWLTTNDVWDNNQSFVVYNWNISNKYSNIWNLKFSSDWINLVFTAKIDNYWIENINDWYEAWTYKKVILDNDYLIVNNLVETKVYWKEQTITYKREEQWEPVFSKVSENWWPVSCIKNCDLLDYSEEEKFEYWSNYKQAISDTLFISSNITVNNKYIEQTQWSKWIRYNLDSNLNIISKEIFNISNSSTSLLTLNNWDIKLPEAIESKYDNTRKLNYNESKTKYYFIWEKWGDYYLVLNGKEIFIWNKYDFVDLSVSNDFSQYAFSIRKYDETTDLEYTYVIYNWNTINNALSPFFTNEWVLIYIEETQDFQKIILWNKELLKFEWREFIERFYLDSINNILYFVTNYNEHNFVYSDKYNKWCSEAYLPWECIDYDKSELEKVHVLKKMSIYDNVITNNTKEIVNNSEEKTYSSQFLKLKPKIDNIFVTLDKKWISKTKLNKLKSVLEKSIPKLTWYKKEVYEYILEKVEERL